MMQTQNSAPMRTAQPFNDAAFRRELKEEGQRQREAAIVSKQVSQVTNALSHIYGRKASIDAAAIHKIVSAYPLIPASRKGAAVHECGHFVADEREGLLARTARIEGSPFNHHGWGGEATHWGDLYLEPRRWPHDPENFCRNARAILAGPIAEELLGDRNAMGNFAELMQARAYSDRAAELLPDLYGAVWCENVFETVAVIECYTAQIFELATVLAKRREITRNSRGVSKILKTIKPRTPIGTNNLSPRGKALACRIVAETPRVAGFVVTK
ncbi:hypothetical protein [Methylocystis iwaonis]|uniref:hypothetical protein n=1 Tax=Methylocystis iwaonis TaxID=2885079 RepID=UPI002E7AE982|nr:hypothetical protein [Methylocystis iwaonis]